MLAERSGSLSCGIPCVTFCESVLSDSVIPHLTSTTRVCPALHCLNEAAWAAGKPAQPRSQGGQSPRGTQQPATSQPRTFIYSLSSLWNSHHPPTSAKTLHSSQFHPHTSLPQGQPSMRCRLFMILYCLIYNLQGLIQHNRWHRGEISFRIICLLPNTIPRVRGAREQNPRVSHLL